MSEMCPCGKPLHYTDPVAEGFTRDLISALGPIMKVSCPAGIFEVPRHYIALHGLKAVEVAEVAERYGFSQVSTSDLTSVGEGDLEPVPGSLDGEWSDEALLLNEEADIAAHGSLTRRTLPPSPMRSAMPEVPEIDCLLCSASISALVYVDHLLVHGTALLASRWLGGFLGLSEVPGNVREVLKGSLEGDTPLRRDLRRIVNNDLDRFDRIVQGASRLEPWDNLGVDGSPAGDGQEGSAES